MEWEGWTKLARSLSGWYRSGCKNARCLQLLRIVYFFEDTSQCERGDVESPASVGLFRTECVKSVTIGGQASVVGQIRW